MSESETQSAMSEHGQRSPASPGGMLRVARQAAGIHIEALAVALKVPVSKLEALEADNYQVLPDAVFVRALASSVCRSLKMDPAPVLALMPRSSMPRLAADNEGINASFKDGTEKVGRSAIVANAMHPAILAAMVLVLGAVTMAFFPRSLHETPAVASSVDQKPMDASSEPTGAVDMPGTVASVGMVIAPAATEAVSESLPVLSSTADTESPPSSPGPAFVVQSSDEVQLLVLRARSDSWVQVRDVTGATVLQKILSSGESAVVPGKPPLSVVVGNAGATEVMVRGKVLDLAPITRDNVARFEVKQ